MARAGSFGGGGINPFGSGSLGGFSQYDIGESGTVTQDNRAALEAYRVAVAWANGEASNEEYLASLERQLSATTDEQTRLSLQNKIHDTVETIGRAQARASGLDAQINYEMGLLARTDPGNYKWGQVKDSLDSLLAQRRRRDYQNIQSRWDDGEISTEQLRSALVGLIAGLSQDAPDYGDWINVLDQVDGQIDSEKDAAIKQAYQNEEMSDEEMLAYLTTRRDRWNADSPKWDDANREVEDFSRGLANKKQALADNANTQAWNDGKISDVDRLAYVKARLDGMDAGDVDRARWEQEYTNTAFTVTEDTLRYDVQHGTRPMSELIAFYSTYQATLNPGSMLWRSVQTQIESLRKQNVGGGGTGRGKSSGGAGGGAGDGKPKAEIPKVVVDPKTSVTAWSNLIYQGAVNAGSNTKSTPRRLAKDIVQTMIADAKEAQAHGWKFIRIWDPSQPNARTAQRDPFTGAVVKGPDGKTVMVPGNGFVPVDEMTYATMMQADAYVKRAVASTTAAQGNNSWIDDSRIAGLAEDDATHAYANSVVIDGTTVSKWRKDLKEAPDRIREFELRQDYGGIARLAVDADRKADLLVGTADQPSSMRGYLSAEDVAGIEEGTRGIAASDQFRALDWGSTDQFGNVVGSTASYINGEGAVVTGVPLGVAMEDWRTSAVPPRSVTIEPVIKPTWFFNLDAGAGHDADNNPTWRLTEKKDMTDGTAFGKTRPDGSTEPLWLHVTTDIGGRVVDGWTKIKDPPTGGDPLVSIRMRDGGEKQIPASLLGDVVTLRYVSFPVPGGLISTAMSIDGVRWAYSPSTSANPRLVLSGAFRFEEGPVPQQLGSDGEPQTGLYLIMEDGTKLPDPLFISGVNGLERNPAGFAGVPRDALAGAVTWGSDLERPGPARRLWSVTQKRWVNQFQPGAVWDSATGEQVSTGYAEMDANGTVSLFSDPDAMYTMVHGYDPETGYMSGGRAQGRYEDLVRLQNPATRGDPRYLGASGPERKPYREAIDETIKAARRATFPATALTGGERFVFGGAPSWGSIPSGKTPIVGWTRRSGGVARLAIVNPEAPVSRVRPLVARVASSLEAADRALVGTPRGLGVRATEPVKVVGLPPALVAQKRKLGPPAPRPKLGPPAPKPKPKPKLGPPAPKPKTMKAVNKPVAS